MIKGILFDKDGTLIDFFDLWEEAARTVIPAFMRENGIEETEKMREYLFRTIGMSGGKVDPKGPLAFEPYEEIASHVKEALAAAGINIPCKVIHRQLVSLFSAYINRPEIQFKPLFHLKHVFRQLKERGIFIGLATADTLASAENCLDTLGVREYFDYVGADDGKQAPKPAPDMLLTFAAQTGIQPEEIAVVGDTFNDIRFARQCGSVAVGVLSGVSTRADYYREADYIFETASDVVKLCGEEGRRDRYGADSIRACV
ncbi:HAD family hydrolase [[Clostridium] hylemonae]|uniref:HAD family hydrolase n=1 Tax=[Clostridium] hylemonae TaxID=89153 RepID=UPI001FCC1DFC|nr:HAD family hydrolase [[Clostridium] hylemonae]BDF06172.1 phosphoglycolate phosphatase [[Clostridium] hylemonae]